MKRLRLALGFVLLVFVAGAVPAAASGERFSGVIEVEHADHFDAGYSVDDVRLRTEDGTLEMADRSLSRLAGKQVTLTATRRGDVLFAATVLEVSDAPAAGPDVSWPSRPPRLGPRRVAVLLASSPADVARRWNPAETRELMFGAGSSVASFYRDASHGQVSLSGDVLGWYASVHQRCDTALIREQAMAAARAEGVRFSDYHHVVIMFPRLPDCGWNGMGQLSGPTSWINGEQREPRLTVHELGHNFGLYHSGASHCTQDGAAVTISDTCAYEEYGDPLDVMGFSPKLFHASRRAALGFMAAEQTRRVRGSGLFDLRSVNSEGPGVKQLVIERPGRGPFSTDQPEYYSLEYRTSFGAFDAFAPDDTAVTGVGVRLTFGEDYGGSITRTLDMTPGSPGGHRDGQLRAGERFTDPRPGVSFAVESISAGVARVRVGPPPGAPAAAPAATGAGPQPPSRPAIAADGPVPAARDTARPALRLMPAVPRRGRKLPRSRRLNVRATDAGGGLRIEARLDGRVVASGAGGRLAVRLPARARRGRHTLELAATDAAGNRQSVRIQLARGVLRPAR